MNFYQRHSKKIVLSAFTWLLLAAAPLASQASPYMDQHKILLPPIAQNSKRPPLPPSEDRYSTRPPSPNVSQQKAKSHPEYRVPERQGWEDRGRQDFRKPHRDKPGFEKRPPAKPHAKPHKHKNKDKDRKMRRPPKHGKDPREMRRPPRKPKHAKPEPRRDRNHKDRHAKKRR